MDAETAKNVAGILDGLHTELRRVRMDRASLEADLLEMSSNNDRLRDALFAALKMSHEGKHEGSAEDCAWPVCASILRALGVDE